jgi:hypothetical protein
VPKIPPSFCHVLPKLLNRVRGSPRVARCALIPTSAADRKRHTARISCITNLVVDRWRLVPDPYQKLFSNILDECIRARSLKSECYRSFVPAFILQAIELVPVGRVKTEPIRLFEDDRYLLNLEEHDLFAQFINLRTVIKKQQQEAESRNDHEDAAFYKSMQEGLKELANATSYGIQVQLDVLPPTKRKKPVTVYGMQTDETSTHQIERPGTYFAGPIGALITAAGRFAAGYR